MGETGQSDQAIHEIQSILDEMGRVARIGGWELDLLTGRGTWTRSLYEVLEVEFEPPPGVNEHLDYYPPPHREVLAEALRRLVERDEPLDIEVQGYTAKGTLKWWRVHGRAIRQDGRCVKLRGVFQDIDERKHAEQRLRDHIRVLEILGQIDEVIRQATDLEEMLRQVVCLTRAAFEADRAWLYRPSDLDGEAFHPPAYCCLPPYAIPADGIHGLPLGDAIRDVFRRVMEASGPVTWGLGNDHPIPKDLPPDACYGVRSRIACAIRPESGGPWLVSLHQCSRERVWTAEERRLLQRIAGRMADGLGRLLAHQAIEQHNARLRMYLERFPGIAFQSIPQTVTPVMIEGTIEAMTGYRADEFFSGAARWLEIMHPEDRPRFLEEHERLIAEPGHVMDIEYRIVRKDGQVRWVRGIRQLTHAGGDALVQGFIVDIDQAKKAQREREELIAKLESQNAELERFAYTVSHDLKSPLITITGYLGLLETDALKGDREAVRDDAARIATAARRMQQLLDELLELSRVGRLAHEVDEVSLVDLVREVVDVLAGPIESAGARVEIARDLPRVWADRRRLSEVYQNLIENAVKYSGQQPRPRIEVGVRGGADQPVLFVRDNGIGIEPRYHERIFGLFDKLDPKSEGTGIGLAMAKRIVQLHGGRIWVESDGPGHGSTFCFTLAKPDATGNASVKLT